MFFAVGKAVAERGEPLVPAARAWGAELAAAALSPPVAAEKSWTTAPLPSRASSASPWALQQRVSTDGDSKSVFFGSLPLGEQLTGVIRSQPFDIPPKLSMYVAGHNGYPGRSDPPKNFLRLRSADDDTVLIERVPPRQDVAYKMEWDTAAYAGRRGYLEVVDGDDGDGFAWLAFGRIDPSVAPWPSASPAMIQLRRRAAAEIVATLSLSELGGALQNVVEDRAADIDTRAAAAGALAQVGTESFVPVAAKLIDDPQEPSALREKVAAALGKVGTEASHAALVRAFRTAPARLQTSLADAMATTPQGAAALLQAIGDGAAPRTLLQQSKLRERLVAAKVPDLDATIRELTLSLPAPQERLQTLIDQRRDIFASAGKPSVEEGARVYAKNCAQCHQLGGEGKLVGPQLDGIGNRGVERVIEDILDPNRNVDPAFRYSNVTLKDTTLITGLQKREEGETLVFVDTTGKEVTVAKKQIKGRAESSLSIMPSNFGEIIPAEEFNQPLAFLMASKPPPAK